MCLGRCVQHMPAFLCPMQLCASFDADAHMQPTKVRDGGLVSCGSAKSRPVWSGFTVLWYILASMSPLMIPSVVILFEVRMRRVVCQCGAWRSNKCHVSLWVFVCKHNGAPSVALVGLTTSGACMCLCVLVAKHKKTASGSAAAASALLPDDVCCGLLDREAACTSPWVDNTQAQAASSL